MDGDAIDMEEIARKRVEKDLHELKRLIEDHYAQRKKDEEDLAQLVTRIEHRKDVRAKQLIEKAAQEKERMAREKEEARRRQEIEEKRKADEEAKKKEALASMSINYGGYLSRAQEGKKGKRATERDKKKKILAERRKPLNIDHLDHDKLVEKTQELWKWLFVLSEEKYDFGKRAERCKYELTGLRNRINDMQKSKQKTVKRR